MTTVAIPWIVKLIFNLCLHVSMCMHPAALGSRALGSVLISPSECPRMQVDDLRSKGSAKGGGVIG